MSGTYDDIINRPHPTSARHPRMPIADRAAIFSPFAALVGHGAAIEETARLTDQRIELTEEEKAEQAALRQEYVASVRANLRGQLDSITIQKEDGTLENLGEKYGGKSPRPEQ